MFLAEINKENNLVTRVIINDSDSLPTWAAESDIFFWVQTTNSEPGKRLASVGDEYRKDLNAFIPPKPYPSWILDENTATWIAPVPHPDSDMTNRHLYVWDEEILNWLTLDKPE